MRHPIRLWQLGAGFLAGNLILHSLPALPGPEVLLVLMLVAVAIGVAVRSGHLLSGVLVAAIAGFVWTAFVAGHGLSSRWPAERDRADLAVTGWVDTMPQHDAERIVFSLRVVDARIDQLAADSNDIADGEASDDTATAAASGISAPRRLRLSWYAPVPPLEAGQALSLTVRMRAPRGLANAAGFDYERWLFTEGIDATGYVRAGRVDDIDYGIAQRWLRLRARLADGIRRSVADPDAVALLQALGLGERGGFTDHHWTVLQRTGTSHLVAVSGLHIGLIAAFSFALCLWLVLWLPGFWSLHAHRIAALFCILPAAGYAALAGFSLPTQRALVMVVIAQLLILSRRSFLAWNALSLAMLAVLVPDPLVSLSASFWLSFGAVALLLMLAAQGRQSSGLTSGSTSGHSGFNWLTDLTRLQWALSLGLAPLVVWFFGQVSLASFIVNLLAIPVFSFIVVPISLAMVVVVLTGIAIKPIALAAGFVAGLAWNGLELAARSPLAAFSLPQPGCLVLILAMLTVLVLIVPVRLPSRCLVITGVLPLLLAARDSPAPGDLRVEVIDVGLGLSVLVTTESHALLFDAGAVYRSGFDSGAEIVVPALAYSGIDHLDMIVVSHADNDHAGGVASVRARYPDAMVLGGPDVTDSDAIRCRSGQHWTWDGIEFEILHPAPGFGPPGNETSCVLRVLTPSGSLLITGDIERRAEARLTAGSGSGAAAKLAADVVIVPHHGSLTSSSPAFVAAVKPTVAIASTDFSNRWGFPRAEVVDRWESAGSRFLSTGADGAVTICFCEQQVSVSRQREADRHYWTATSVSGAGDQSAL